MSRSGNVRFKSVHCLMLCVWMAAALAFSGCGGTGAESSDPAGISADEPGGGIADEPGTDGDSGAETDVGAGGDTGAETDVGAGGDTGAETDVGSGGDPAGGAAEELKGQDAAEEDGLPEELLISSETEAEREVQEIVAEPSGRKGPLPEIYDPNPAYDKYALVEYAIDDIGAEFTATVSAEDDDSEFEVHCNLGKAEQVVILDMDYSVVYDRTGEMGSDAPLIVQMAVEEGDWRSIGE